MDLSGVSTVDELVARLRAAGWNLKKDEQSEKKVVLEEKYFRRMEKYGGEEGKWQEWVFNLLVQVGQVSGEVWKAMDGVL